MCADFKTECVFPELTGRTVERVIRKGRDWKLSVTESSYSLGMEVGHQGNCCDISSFVSVTATKT